MKKIPMILINFMFANVCLLGCSDELKKTSNPQPTQDQALKALNKDSISYALTPTSEPNRYQVIISWGKTSDMVEVSTNGQKKFSARQTDEGFSEVLDGGKTYQYSVAVFNPDRTPKDQTEYSIEVPRDQVLSGPLELKGDAVIAANRVFIKSDAVITTYRNRLLIDTSEIFAEGGVVQNYPWGFQDCVEFAGYPGGDIKIKARKAQGSLSIISLGARGCMFQGPGGAGGNLSVDIDEGTNFIIDLQLKRALGSPALSGMGWADGPLGAPGTSCISLKKGASNGCK